MNAKIMEFLMTATRTCTLGRRPSPLGNPPWSPLTPNATSGGLELPSMGAMGLPLPLPQTGASSIRSETGSAILIHGQSQSQEPQGKQGRRRDQRGDQRVQGGQTLGSRERNRAPRF